MQDNNDDGGHRTPLRWPPRVGRRQWKPRAGGPSPDASGYAHGDASHGSPTQRSQQGPGQGPNPGSDHGPHAGQSRSGAGPLRDGSRDTSAGPQRDGGPHAREPHERDESVEKVGVPEVRTKQRKTIQRAYEDVTNGRVDTDLRGHLHETYGRLRRKPDPSR